MEKIRSVKLVSVNLTVKLLPNYNRLIIRYTLQNIKYNRGYKLQITQAKVAFTKYLNTSIIQFGQRS